MFGCGWGGSKVLLLPTKNQVENETRAIETTVTGARKTEY